MIPSLLAPTGGAVVTGHTTDIERKLKKVISRTGSSHFLRNLFLNKLLIGKRIVRKS